MADFKFRLHTVLDVKKKVEDGHKRQLAQLKLLLQNEEIILEKLEDKKCRVQETIRSQQDAKIDVQAILNYYNYLAALGEKIVEQIVTIKELLDSVERKRDDLIEASRERKMIERLKENQFREFRTTAERLEMKVLDEIATNGYNRRE
jgi:flagellar protein FliJ